MQISLAKLPWYAQVGAFALLAIAAAGGYVWYYELPLRADMATREQQLVSLRADVAKAQATANKLPAFRSRVAELEGRLDALRSVLPDDKDAGDMLRRLQAEATAANLTIKGFKPGPAVVKQLHAEWPIGLELEGTYHNLATFFDHIGKAARIVNVTDVDVKAKAQPDARATITATCVTTTFVLIDKKDAAKNNKAAGSVVPVPSVAAKGA